MARWPWTWPRPNFPIPNTHFPNLMPGRGGNHKRISWSTHRYNCIAWADDDPLRPWWPRSSQAYWPAEAPNEESVPAFVAAFATRGYAPCCDATLETGFEKIAIFARGGEPTHAARQLRDGKWTSKMGAAYWPDIRHDTLDVVSGPGYGAPACYMKRERNPFTLRGALYRIARAVRILAWEVRTFVRWFRFGGNMYCNWP